MYQAMSCSGYYHGRSCPICTRCFHRCSARIPAIPSSVVSRHGSRSDRPSKKPTVFRWGPPPPRSNRANLRRKDFFFAASKRHFFLRLGSVGWGGIRWGVPDRTNQRDFGGVGLPRPDPTWYRDPCHTAVVRVRGDTSLFIFVTGLRPPTVLKVHTGPQRSSERTHGGFCCQHQRKVKNTQIYEFYHFPKNGRMHCGLQGTPADSKYTHPLGQRN